MKPTGKLLIRSIFTLGITSKRKLWWSNEDGWGGRETATEFTVDESRELTLPVGGEWVYEPAIFDETLIE